MKSNSLLPMKFTNISLTYIVNKKLNEVSLEYDLEQRKINTQILKEIKIFKTK